MARELPRRVGVRFYFEVEVYVSSAWIETHSMKQIEDQARIEAEAHLRDLLEKDSNIKMVGKLGYRFTLAEERVK